MMERLTETNNGSVFPADQDIHCSVYCTSCTKTECSFINKCLRRLAAYEDTGRTPEEVRELFSWSYGPFHKKIGEWLQAEEEGRLVVLPCKVGDTIYRFSKERDEVWDWQIEEIRILSGDYCDPISFVDDSENEFFASDIGKTVFLTRAEAEAAMKGVSEDG